jgi:hypothetical protein
LVAFGGAFGGVFGFASAKLFGGAFGFEPTAAAAVLETAIRLAARTLPGPACTTATGIA